MPIFRENWIPAHSVIFDDWDDIDYSITGTMGLVTIRGMSLVAGGVIFPGYIASISEFGCIVPPEPEECNPLPPDADPPFPPTYPYPFTSDVIYGRNHLSLNLKMVRGDTYQFDSVVFLNGQPFDLTDCTVRMTAKWSVRNPDLEAVFQLSTLTSGITVTDATAGEISIVIASDLTSDLPAKTIELPYDIQVVDEDGNVYTVLLGTLIVVPDVTITGT